MVQRQVLLKVGGWHFSYLIFPRFIIIKKVEITLLFAKLCYAFEEIFFFCYHNFMKKVIRICVKLNLKISHELR